MVKKTLAARFWRWYERHYLLNLSVATALFLLQAFHLYWLFTDVILERLTGHSYFIFPRALWPVYVLVDYTEIPALIMTSAVYLHSLGKRNSLQAWLALAAINIQWVHLFWITDEVVLEMVGGKPFIGMPPVVAWIAILIDYLELPVMVDTVRRLITTVRNLRLGGQAQLWKEHWREEGDAAYVYRKLATADTDPSRITLYTQLAVVEDQHVARWAEILRRTGVRVERHRPSFRVRGLTLIGRVIGWQLPATILLAEERREMEGYLRRVHEYTDPDAVQAAQTLAKEAAEHAQQLSDLLGIAQEPWHRTESLGSLQRAAHHFSTGLIVTVGLIMGFVGIGAPHGLIRAAAVAAVLAEALAIGGLSYLQARGERERLAHETAMEREELRLMPDLEEAELALVYRSRGLTAETARQAAHAVMQDPERALEEKRHIEFGAIDPPSPRWSGWVAGLSTAAGAAIPAAPFVAAQPENTLWLSVSLSLLVTIAVGITRSVLTGRHALRSTSEMVIAGGVVALACYLVGRWIAVPF